MLAAGAFASDCLAFLLVGHGCPGRRMTERRGVIGVGAVSPPAVLRS